MVMEDNTEYLVKKIWLKILPSTVLADLIKFILILFGVFALVAKFCSEDEMVVYSIFQPLWFLSSLAGCVFAYAAPQIFSRYKGAAKHEEAVNLFCEICTTMFCMLIAVNVLSLTNMGFLVDFFKVSNDLRPLAIKYGYGIVLACSLDVVCNCFRSFMRSDSQAKKASLFLMLDSIIVMILVIIAFVYLKLNVLYLPIILVIGSMVEILCFLYMLVTRKVTLRYRVRWMRFDNLKGCLALSSGEVVDAFCSLLIGIFTVRWAVSCFNEKVVTIIALCSLAYNFGNAMSKGINFIMQSLTGVFIGDNNIKGVRISLMHGLKLLVMTEFSICVLLLIFAGKFAAWMNVEGNYAGEAAFAVRMCALGMVPRNAFYYMLKYVNSRGYTKFITLGSLLFNCVVLFIGLPFFCFVVGKENLFWLYMPVDDILVLGCLMFLVWLLKKKEKKTMLLLDEEKQVYPSLYLLMRDDDNEFQLYNNMVEIFLRKQNIKHQNIIRCVHLFEEIYLFARDKIERNKQTYILIEIKKYEDRITISLRYDSPESCLKSALNGYQKNVPPSQLAGAMILDKLSDEVYIDLIYGFNFVRLTLNCQPENGAAI